MNVLQRLQSWHQTKVGLLFFGLTELSMAYGFVSWAIDSGRLSAWTLSLVLAIGAVYNFVILVRRFVRRPTPSKPRRHAAIG